MITERAYKGGIPQPPIFQAIQNILDHMDKQASLHALAIQPHFNLDAFNPKVFPVGKRSRAGGGGN